MKNYNILWKVSLRAALAGLVFIIPMLACNGPLASPPAAAQPSITRTISVEQETQGVSQPASLTDTAPPEKTSSPNPAISTTTFQARTAPVSLATETLSANSIGEIIGKVNRDRALNDLQQLTGDKPICILRGCFSIKNRFTGTEGLQWAKEYVYEELARLGYTVKLQDWSKSGRADQNIITRKQGTALAGDEIYFVAHLDGVGWGAPDPYPAADDNASGVVDILELARVLRTYSFSRSVVFLISTGEESGTLGVQYYISQLSSAEISAIKYVVNLDMIGYDANQDAVMELWHGGHAPSIAFANLIMNIIQTHQLNLKPRLVEGCG